MLRACPSPLEKGWDEAKKNIQNNNIKNLSVYRHFL